MNEPKTLIEILVPKDGCHIISLGAGVQSSTMALMAARGELTPMPRAAIFADTHAEPKTVYRWLDWLEKQLPFPVHRVSAGSLEEASLRVRTSKKGKKYMLNMMPMYRVGSSGSYTIMPRSCTRDFKIKPVQQFLRRMTKEHVHQWFGITIDEAHRMKQSGKKWLTNEYPMVDKRMKRGDCLEWMKRNGYPEPPRSACVFCPYHSNREWAGLPPDEMAAAVKYETDYRRNWLEANPQDAERLPFLHRKMIPLSEVDLKTDVEKGQSLLWGNECEGMCGV